MTKISEIGQYQICLNEINWFTVFKMHKGGELATRCGSYETYAKAKEYVERNDER